MNTMEMKTYIELGEKKAGKQTELGRILGIKENYLRNAKSGRAGLPDAICIKLADYLEVNPLQVIAASNLVTEKDEERRKIFESCFTRAASAIFALAAVYNFPLLSGKTNAYFLAMAEQFVLC